MANLGQHEFYEYWILEVGPIWVRSEPCHEKGERVGHEKQGTYVASARRVGNWERYDVRAEIEAARGRRQRQRRRRRRAPRGPRRLRAVARRPILFVGGLHRSGTTIFTSLLNESPLVAGFRDTDAPEDEGQHLQDVVPTDESFGGVGRFAEESLHWTEDTARPEPRASAPKLLEAWDAHWTSGLPAKKRRARVPVLLEKSPANLVHLRWLRAAFGARARFVVMARHPLAVAFATRKFMQQRAARVFLFIFRGEPPSLRWCYKRIADAEPTDEPPPPLRDCLANWVEAMELFTADDELLGRPTRVVRLDEFREDRGRRGRRGRVPRGRVAARAPGGLREGVEAGRRRGLPGPVARLALGGPRGADPGRAENVRDRPRDDDDEGCADDDDAPPAPAPATSSRRAAASQLPLKEADWEEICWLQDEIGASTIIAEFGDAFEKFGFPCWPHPGEEG
ncbi:procollagen-lysine 5-dioxygenase [Aureococcus anophagefferens]|nr:procollagen-lysine 5-dioxygenase [Aureococcus anophagefferens]